MEMQQAGGRAPSPNVRADYDLSMARLDPDVPLDDHRNAMAVVQGWFRQAGLTPEEAKLLVDRFNAAIDPYSRPATATDRVSEEGDQYLRARWGKDYPQSMDLVELAIARLGGEPLEQFLRESGLRFDPFVLRTLADAARRNNWGNETITATPEPGSAAAGVR